MLNLAAKVEQKSTRFPAIYWTILVPVIFFHKDWEEGKSPICACHVHPWDRLPFKIVLCAGPLLTGDPALVDGLERGARVLVQVSQDVFVGQRPAALGEGAAHWAADTVLLVRPKGLLGGRVLATVVNARKGKVAAFDYLFMDDIIKQPF
jgi:hypothetical protein